MSNGIHNKLSLASKVLNFLGIVMLATGFLVTTISQPVEAAPADMVTICHAAGRDGTLQFVTLTISWEAAFGQAGHFYEDGTPRAGHENDYLGPCIVPATETATATATNTPTNIPTNTATNTPTNTATNTPTNTPTDTPTNTPTGTFVAPTNTPTNTATNTPVPTDTPEPMATIVPTDPPDTIVPTDPPATIVPTDPPVTVNTLPAPEVTAEVLIPVTGADLNAFNRTQAGRMMMNLGSLLLGLGLVLHGISRKQ